MRRSLCGVARRNRPCVLPPEKRRRGLSARAQQAVQPTAPVPARDATVGAKTPLNHSGVRREASMTLPLHPPVSAPPVPATSPPTVVRTTNDSEDAPTGKIGLASLRAALTPEQLRSLQVLVGASMVSECCTSVASPVMPVFAASIGLGGSGLGMLLSAPYLAKVLVNLKLGQVADCSTKRVPMMVAGESMAALAMVGSAFATSLPTMLPCRMLVGAGGAAAEAGTTAFLTDLTSQKHVRPYRGVIIGLKVAALSGAWAIGPALGGALTSAHGTGTAFLAVAGLTGVCAAAFSTLGSIHQHTSPLSAFPSHRDGKAATEEPRLPLTANDMRLLAVNVALNLNYACFGVIVPLQAMAQWGASPLELGLLYSTSSGVSMLGAPLSGVLTDRFGRKAGIVPGLALCSTGVACVAMADSPAPILGSLIVWSVGEALLGTSVASMAADSAPKEAQGTYLARVRQAGDAMLLAGPVTLGVVVDLAGPQTTLALVSGLSVVAVLPALFLEPPPAPAAAATVVTNDSGRTSGGHGGGEGPAAEPPAVTPAQKVK